jgi:hypothetical protein
VGGRTNASHTADSTCGTTVMGSEIGDEGRGVTDSIVGGSVRS